MGELESFTNKEAVYERAVSSLPDHLAMSNMADALPDKFGSRLSPVPTTFLPDTVPQPRGRGKHLFGMPTMQTELPSAPSSYQKGPDDIKVEPAPVKGFSLPLQSGPARAPNVTMPQSSATPANPYGAGGWHLTPPPPPPSTPFAGTSNMATIPDLGKAKNLLPRSREATAHHHSSSRCGKPNPALLSGECQKRGFNPQFHEWMDSNGKFHCSVNIKDMVYKSPRGFNTWAEAKDAVAKRALLDVRKMPMRGLGLAPVATEPVNQSKAPSAFAGPTQTPREPLSSRDEQGGVSGPRSNRSDFPLDMSKVFAHAAAPDHPAGHRPRRAPHGPTHRNDQGHHRESELHSLMNRVHALCGPSRGPSKRVMEDPLASRAFLEGMALGARLDEPARQQHKGGNRQKARSRSSSPLSGRAPIRDRSPMRRRIVSYKDE
ncbi:hypothetical protein F5Y04DRAFT_278660 [Hypomontagnella monticulosa]|nr:hypothetical protein F5Y04DRAFT_278660 [Hypomontagnella monticulosa]